jgi:hypothetical protein
MRLRLVSAGIVTALTAALATPSLDACGVKFLLPALGTHFERSRASRQAAAVLIYATPTSQLSRTLTSLSVTTALEKEGYRPSLVSTPTAFNAAMHATAWDVIVVDGAEMTSQPAAQGATPAPRILPVLASATKDEVKSAKATCGTALDKPTKARAFVDAIDAALDLHDADIRAAAKKAAR